MKNPAKNQHGVALLRAVVLCLLSAFALAACGGGDDGGSTAAPSQTGPNSTSPDLNADEMALSTNQSAPTQARVTVSLMGAAQARSAAYFLDSVALGSSTAGPAFEVLFDTRNYADGNHTLKARVERSDGSTVELSLPFQIAHPTVFVSFEVFGTSGDIKVQASASAFAGIQSVQLLVNNVAQGTLTRPNLSETYYAFSFDSRGLPAGPAAIKVVATDDAGVSAQSEKNINIVHPPSVALISPVEGQIAIGSLEVRGTFVDDQPGASVSVWIDQTEILNTTTSPFETAYSVSGFSIGKHLVTVRGRDAENNEVVLDKQIIITSASSLNYELVSAVDGEARLLETQGGALLYKRPNGIVRFRDSSGAETAIQISPETVDQAQWQISDGRVAALLGRHIYLFDGNGVSEDVNDAFGGTTGVDGLVDGLLFRSPWLIWKFGFYDGGFRLLNVNSREMRTVPAPTHGVLSNGSFISTPGNEQLFFIASQGPAPNPGDYDIYRYRLADQTTEKITGAPGFSQVNPDTDGSRLAWLKAPTVGFVDPPYELITASVDAPASVTTLSTTMTRFGLGAGVLAWVEEQPTAKQLKANDGTTTTTISSLSSVALYSVSGGYVLFTQAGKFYAWDPAHGTRVLLDVVPNAVLQEGNYAFLTLGRIFGENAYTGTAIYRIPLQ